MSVPAMAMAMAGAFIITMSSLSAQVQARPIDDFNPDIIGEGFDMLYSLEQYKTLNPDTLVPFEGSCVRLASVDDESVFTLEHVHDIDTCLTQCINFETETQQEMGACEVVVHSDSEIECRILPVTIVGEDVHVEATADRTCYVLAPGRRRTRRDSHASSTSELKSKRAMVPDANTWPDNEIPYVIMTSSSPYSWHANGVDQTQALQYLNQAFGVYHTLTNIKFRPRDGDAHYIKIGYFGGGCSSYVGNTRRSGGQAVTLGWCHNRLGSIVHELGHSVGLWHEHTRADRDSYINVPSTSNNFRIQSTSDPRGTAYDFGSIMHYPMATRWSFGWVIMTMTTLGDTLYKSQNSPTIGQRVELSPLDIEGLLKLYPVIEAEEEVETTVTVTSVTATSVTVPQQPTLSCHYVSPGNPTDLKKKEWKCESHQEEYNVRCCSDATENPYPQGKWQQLSSNHVDHCPWVVSEALSEASEYKKCPKKMNYNDAFEYCANADARLCTREEMVHCSYGSGCGLGSKYMWTSSHDGPPTDNPTSAPTTVPPTLSPTTSSPTEAPSTSAPTQSPAAPIPTPTSSPTTFMPTSAPSPSTAQPTAKPTAEPQCHMVAPGRAKNLQKTPTKCAGHDETHRVRCCSDATVDPFPSGNWVLTNKNDCNNVWSAEKNMAAGEDGKCLSRMTYADASAYCTSVSARLCSLDEMVNDCTVLSDCKINKDHLWTSTPGGPPPPTTAAPTHAPTTPSPTTSPVIAPTKAPTPPTPQPMSAECHIVRTGKFSKSKPPICQDNDVKAKVVCCSDSDPASLSSQWKYNGASGVWSAGKDFASGSKSCRSGSTYDDADNFCSGLGTRLCTEQELEDNYATGTSCGYNSKYVWTSSTSV
eukprot:m.130167 g.130167  ORF g.130167 m.130167 type:complete len:872 (-) comp29462_c0_seq1:155-2770(-)